MANVDTANIIKLTNERMCKKKTNAEHIDLSKQFVLN